MQKNLQFDFFGTFKNNALEKAYFTQEREKTKGYLSGLVLTFGVIFLLIALFDYTYDPDPVRFYPSLYIRMAFFSFCLIASILLRRTQSRFVFMLLLMLLPVSGSYVYFYILSIYHSFDLAYQAITVLIIIFFSSHLPICWVALSVVNLSIVAGYYFVSFTFLNAPFIDMLEITVSMGLVTIFTQFFKRRSDITQRLHYAREQKVIEQSIKDILTGCYNRLWLDRKINEYTSSKSSYSLILFDIDHFKQVNDRYGHQAGDQVLQEIACLVRDTLGEDFYLSRWGGEEFVVLMPGACLMEGLEMAEKLRLLIFAHDFGLENHVSCSFGITYAEPGNKPEAVMRRADELLYIAKDRGRNRIEWKLSPTYRKGSDD